jgi:Mannosyltransferase (PIG-V)
VRASESFRAALRAFLWSRAAILAVAVYAALTVGPGGLGAANERRYDDSALTQPLGGFGDVVLSPLAHWDAVWFLGIADTGYPSADSPRTAFFPLYPLLIRGVGELGGGSRGALLIAAYLVSLGALLGALVLLYRLTALELGRRAAGPAVLLLCLFPASLFLGAPYSESLFLLCSLGAFYAARTGRWAWAGAAAGAASATRSAGLLLLLPLALIYLYGPRADRPGEQRAVAARGWLAGLRPVHPPRRDAAWLALAPLGLAAYAAWLGAAHGDPLAFAGAQDFWGREFAGPLVGVWDGAVAAFDGARQLLSGSSETVYFDKAGGDPMRVAAINLMLFGFLCFGIVAAVGILRRLPFAYGAYVVAALMLPLSYPVEPQPLMSLPRFLLVLFPIFMWLAVMGEERRATTRYAAMSAIGLGLLTVEFAGWRFIA